MVKSPAGSTPLAYSSPEAVQTTGTVAVRRQLGCTNISCFVRPKGPLLRPDLPPPMTAAAGRGKDRRRRPAKAGAQRPCGGLLLRSHSLKEGPLPDPHNNLCSNDS